MTVGIIGYGMGNLGSIRRAIDYIGETSQIITTSQEARNCSHIILPGVGGFSEAMALIKHQGIDDMVKEVQERNQPLLGICLGMQLCADFGLEGEQTDGLSIVPGSIEKLPSQSSVHKVPHIGWNEVIYHQDSPLFRNIADRTDFYFVHSFHFKASVETDILAKTDHGINFVCAVGRDNQFGVQFHPEKSSKSGLRLLQNFCELS